MRPPSDDLRLAQRRGRGRLARLDVPHDRLPGGGHLARGPAHLQKLRAAKTAAGVRPAPDLFVAEHRRIFDAVAAGEVEAAVDSLIANLRTTEKLLAEIYESVPHRVS